MIDEVLRACKRKFMGLLQQVQENALVETPLSSAPKVVREIPRVPPDLLKEEAYALSVLHEHEPSIELAIS